MKVLTKKINEWADALRKIFNSMGKKKYLRPSMGIGTVCLLIAIAAWFAPVYFDIGVQFEVVTQNVSLVLSEEWANRDRFTANGIFLDSIEKIRAQGLTPPLELVEQEDASMTLKGDSISIDKISIMKDADLEFRTLGGDVNLFIKKSPLYLTLFVRNVDLKLETDEATINKIIRIPEKDTPPETILLTTTKAKVEPVRFQMVSDGKWIIEGLKARQISFLEEHPPGSGDFQSRVLSGKVKLLETGKIEELWRSENLVLKGLKDTRLEISKTENGLHVLFKGAVAGIKAGLPGYEKNLKPTFLEYIYGQKQLSFFWSTFIFLWGTAWTIRNTFGNQRF